MTVPHYAAEGVTLFHGDCIDVMRELADASVHAIVTDPPYGLGFMGKAWDGLPPGDDFAREAFRVLRPGGHIVAFGGSRTWHRLAVAIEDAGFEIRDSIAWLYGSGFPKSMDVSKAIDKAAGLVRDVPGSRNAAGDKFGFGGSIAGRRDATWVCDRCGLSRGGSASGNCQCDLTGDPITDAAREWHGWGTALKPAFEPIVVARKPLAGTVAANVLTYGTGALNIDGTRIPTTEEPSGRWPTNVVLDTSQADALDAQTGVLTSGKLAAHHARAPKEVGILGAYGSAEGERGYGDSGGASRFSPVFRFEAKAPTSERPVVDGVAHPTVKPLALMRWLCRLVTPAGGTILEPFAGSGTTIEAALLERFDVIGIEREADYLPLILSRIEKDHAVVMDIWGGDAA